MCARLISGGAWFLRVFRARVSWPSKIHGPMMAIGDVFGCAVEILKTDVCYSQTAPLDGFPRRMFLSWRSTRGYRPSYWGAGKLSSACGPEKDWLCVVRRRSLPTSTLQMGRRHAGVGGFPHTESSPLEVRLSLDELIRSCRVASFFL